MERNRKKESLSFVCVPRIGVVDLTGGPPVYRLTNPSDSTELKIPEKYKKPNNPPSIYVPGIGEIGLNGGPPVYKD